MVRIVDPVAMVKYRAKNKLAARPVTLDGKRVGILQNIGWMGAPDRVDKIYPHTAFEKVLREQFEVAGIVWASKPVMGAVAPKEVLDWLSSQVDVVINGTAM